MTEPPYNPFDVSRDLASSADPDGPSPSEPQTEPEVQRLRGPCRHLGPQRRCCGALRICGESPRAWCVTHGLADAGVRVCESCDRWEARSDPIT